MTRSVVVGVLGHVDHGKTALVRALTGIDTDRLAEEKRRGISIALGFAHLDGAADGTAIDLVDMPGHERFVRTMISGATGMAVVLLVVAADEGVRPQTVEHAEIASLLGIRTAVLAVTRADLVDRATATATERAARLLLERKRIVVRSPHVVSAMTGEGVGSLREALCGLADLLSPGTSAGDDGWAFLPIDRAFSLPGAGTVVTGTLRRGAVREGDELEAWVPGRSDAPIPVRVRAVHTRGVRVPVARPNGRTALNLRSIEPSALPRGTVVATRGALRPARRLAVALRAADDAPSLGTGRRVFVLAGTDEIEARLRLLDRDTLEPGGDALAELVAERPVALPAREMLVVRLASPTRTIAGGTVLETGDRRLKRHHGPSVERLGARVGAAPGAIVADVLGRAGAAGSTLRALGDAAGVSAARAASLLDGTGAVISRRGGAVVSAAGWQRLLRLLPPAIAAGRSAAGGGPLLDDAVAQLLRDEVLGRDGNRLFVRDRRHDLARTRTEDELARTLLARLRAGGLAPPPLSELAPEAPVRRILDRLVRSGSVVFVTDRVQKRDWAFHPDAVASARERLGRELPLRPGGLLLGEIGALLGITRRHAVPLLEHLDAARFTRRIDDRRVLDVARSAEKRETEGLGPDTTGGERPR